MSIIQEAVVFAVVLAAVLFLGRAFLHYLAKISANTGGTGCGSCGCGHGQNAETDTVERESKNS